MARECWVLLESQLDSNERLGSNHYVYNNNNNNNPTKTNTHENGDSVGHMVKTPTILTFSLARFLTFLMSGQGRMQGKLILKESNYPSIIGLHKSRTICKNIKPCTKLSSVYIETFYSTA